MQKSINANLRTPVASRKCVAATQSNRLQGMRTNVLGTEAMKHQMMQLRPTLYSTSSRRHSSTITAGQKYVGSLVGEELRIGIIVARFNDLVTKLLLEGAIEACERHGVDEKDIDVVWVPGSFELPVVSKAMAKSGEYDAILAIGAVVRGSTTHYDAVVSAATGGLLSASTDTGVPVVFGVLTCDTMEQALDRAGGKVGNKGAECAITAIEMANLMGTLRDSGKAAKW